MLLQELKHILKSPSKLLNVLALSFSVASPIVFCFLTFNWAMESNETEAKFIRNSFLLQLPILNFVSTQSPVVKNNPDLIESKKSIVASAPKDFLEWAKIKPQPVGEIAQFAKTTFTKDQILQDNGQRISEVFGIPVNLNSRVSFWFDIYTRYGSQVSLIHHSDYPWIIFAKVDITPILNSSGHRWTKYHRAKALVEKTRLQTVEALKKLAKNPGKKNLSQKEQALVAALSEIPGQRHKVFAQAAAATRVQLGQRDFFKNGVVFSAKYITRMEEIFAKHDLPIEITRLPLVESSFNENAYSKVGASGIWQFMPKTGKSYLKVENAIDERNSPIKATEAAAKLFKFNYKILRNWPLAVTAYNHGASGLQKATKVYKTTDLSELIKKNPSKSFGFASKNFYAEFLAALYAEKYHEEIFGDVIKHPELKTETLKLSLATRPKIILDVAELTFEELFLYNPDLDRTSIRRNVALPKGYTLHLPPGKSVVMDNYLLSQKSKSIKPNAPAVKEAHGNKQPPPARKKVVKIDFDVKQKIKIDFENEASIPMDFGPRDKFD